MLMILGYPRHRIVSVKFLSSRKDMTKGFCHSAKILKLHLHTQRERTERKYSVRLLKGKERERENTFPPPLLKIRSWKEPHAFVVLVEDPQTLSSLSTGLGKQLVQLSGILEGQIQKKKKKKKKKKLVG